MAGQSDSSDDLINELSRLMAQDASGNRAKPAAPSFSVRIPGEPKAPQVDVPAQLAAAIGAPMDFLRSMPSLAADSDAPSAAPETARPAPRSEPTPEKPAASPLPEHEAFNFDFDFDIGSGRADSAKPALDSARASPEPDAAPQPPAVDAPVVTTRPSLDEHDSIADLIAADLSGDFAPVPTAVSTPPKVETPTEAISRPAEADASEQPAPRTPPRLDNDRFKVPPVFGLGSSSRPQAPVVASQVPPRLPPRTVVPHVATPPVAVQPPPADPDPADVAEQSSADAASIDPIDEIENLIGRAMRVDFIAPDQEPVIAAPAADKPAPAPSPALRSLATPAPAVSPQRANMSAADEVIFAAAQATGAQVGWVNEPEIARDDLDDQDRAPLKRKERGFHMTRAVAGPLVAIALLLMAGLGLYWVLGLGGREAGPAPLLAADSSPVKEVAPADTSAPQQSVVFNEIDGVAAGADEQLVSRDQTVTDDAVETASAIPAVSEEGLANRKVRTVTVRPDGTIVTSDGGVAGSSILPVDRPNVPAVPGAADTSTELLAAAETPAATPAAATEPAVAATATPVVAGSTVPVVDLAGSPVPGKTAVVPFNRPAGLTLPTPNQPLATSTDSLVQQPAAEANAAPAVAPTNTAPGSAAPAYVQLSSQRTEADARASAQAMVTRYGPLFGGANLEVQRVDLGAKGIYYRVRVPAASAEQANMICTNVKAAGGDCFIM